MDDLVLAAMAKWPNVPAAFGWLGLDARGRWWLRDEATQAAGGFPAARGSLVENERLRGFIGRNYAVDEAGRAFFQNGPQRVFVELESVPWVLAMEPAPEGGGAAARLVTHTGTDWGEATARACWVDERGQLYIGPETVARGGIGQLLDRDLEAASALIEQGMWRPEPIAFAELPARFGFTRSPQPPA